MPELLGIQELELQKLPELLELQELPESLKLPELLELSDLLELPELLELQESRLEMLQNMYLPMLAAGCC